MYRERAAKKEEMRLRLLSKSDLIVVYVLCAHIKELMIRNIGCARSYTKHSTNNDDDDDDDETNAQTNKTWKRKRSQRQKAEKKKRVEIGNGL